ncbi:Pyriculol/pyriculariol biosynthesis cluster transcription factor [Paramyrothecium foliicola]|nr:Pyriculol/pyriculariol biosynthesis cluster transcription factor [Paramyrothecium foliicola]
MEPIPPMKRRQPRRLACVVCQQRKKRCDRQSPCSLCTKLGIACIPSIPAVPRKRRHVAQEMTDRLERCEELLRQAMRNTPPALYSPSPEAECSSPPATCVSPLRFPTTFNTILNISVTHIPGEIEPRLSITGTTTSSADTVMNFRPTSFSIQPDGSGTVQLPLTFELAKAEER